MNAVVVERVAEPRVQAVIDLAAQRLTRTDLARLFGVTEGTIASWARKGEIPKPNRIGKRHYWFAEQIEQLIREGSEK